MDLNKKTFKFIFLTLLLIVSSLFGVHLFQNSNIKPNVEARINEIRNKNKSMQRKQIADLIKQMGADKTYSLLKASYVDDQNEGHNILHIFGEELFKAKKEVGITTCDFTFAYGCYHGFSTEALIEKGDSIMSKLEIECENRASNQPLACSHGLGHGALEYYGRENIDKALEACGKLAWKGKLYGCQDGVFMEYNFPNMIDGENSFRARIIDESSPYGPCDAVGDRFKNACYYSLSQWWSFENRTNYERIGELCNNIDNYLWRRSCYLGVGNDASADADHNPSKAVNQCDLMPTLEGRTVCRAAVYTDVFGRGMGLKTAQIACSDLPKEAQRACEDHSIVSELTGIR